MAFSEKKAFQILVSAVPIPFVPLQPVTLDYLAADAPLGNGPTASQIACDNTPLSLALPASTYNGGVVTSASQTTPAWTEVCGLPLQPTAGLRNVALVTAPFLPHVKTFLLALANGGGLPTAPQSAGLTT